MFDYLIYSICFVALVVGSYTDIKTREVADWLNFSLIGTGIGIRIIFSVIENDFNFIFHGLQGIAVGALIGYLMFYTGQWGGGDSKMIIGLGSLIGFDYTIFPFFGSFLINILFFGAFYGLIWSIFLAVSKWSAFTKKANKLIKEPRSTFIKWIVLIIVLTCLLSLIYFKDFGMKVSVFSLAVLVFMTFYLWVFVRAVESVCMYKRVKPEKLTEGDWIAEEVKVNGKVIAGPKDLGVELKQIKKLIQFGKQKKLKDILIKEGIPFVPSFLIAFLFTLFFDNVLFLLIGVI